MSETVLSIDVDDLGIDTANIRGGEWEYDQELIDSIRENGVILPLVIRLAMPSTGVKYGIVCGSRRYNAGIEAGLTELPCILKEIDNVTAMGISIIENKHRKDIPAWRYALRIGEMFEQLNGNGKKEEIISIIANRTGFSKTSVRDYLLIAGLPGEVIELMKESANRSEVVKELLKGTTAAVETTLSYNKAVKIARELRDASLEKMFEVATYVLGLTKDVAFAIIEKVMSYPMKSMKEIHRMIQEIPMGVRWVFYFGSNLVRALDEACIKKNIDNKSLVLNYVEEGLRRDGYIG